MEREKTSVYEEKEINEDKMKETVSQFQLMEEEIIRLKKEKEEIVGANKNLIDFIKTLRDALNDCELLNDEDKQLDEITCEED